LTVVVPESHAAAVVVVVDVCSVRGGIVRTSSTKSSVERYVVSAVEHHPSLVMATVTTPVFVALLNEPLSCDVWVNAPLVIVTIAAVG
jgi:hypothetical protein